ncbi:MAG: hypothetical protein KAJ12_03820 [Bacteroidetes bacterium]|nr:hypothetical protein [Bacteroidota bacterium]
MSVILDLIGSIVIAGFVILIGLQLNQTIAGNADASTANLNVQEAMVDIVQSIEYDFRKMGYGVPEGVSALIDTGATRISFRADIDNDGTVDVVEWFTGPVITGLPNPNIRVLYRRVNGGKAVGAALGVTDFRLRYLNQDGGPPVSITAIYIIEVTLQVESPYKVQDQIITDQSYEDMGYAVAFWRQTRLASRNIKRHG